MIKFKVVTHYPEDDPSFDTDYCSVDLYRDDELIKQWGDYYHDDGAVKCDAFIEGYTEAVGSQNVTVKRDNVADYEL